MQVVASGSYPARVLNEQVWASPTAAGTVDPAVRLYYTTPGFHDYHWLLGPQAVQRLGKGLPQRLTDYFLGLDATQPADKAVLDLFGAKEFIATKASNYDQIEQIGRQLGLIS